MSHRRSVLLGMIVVVVLFATRRSFALVEGSTYAGALCQANNDEAAKFASRSIRGLTSVTAGNMDGYICPIPNYYSGSDIFGVRATMTVLGPAECVLWAVTTDGFFLDASFASTSDISPSPDTNVFPLTFDALHYADDEDTVFSISCLLENGSSIAAYTFSKCLDESCSAVADDNVCGNGEVDGDEECDDGNNIDTDDCTNACLAAATCDPCAVAMTISGASAGGAVQTPASNAKDGNLATRYTNDGSLSSASIQLHLEGPGVVSGLRLAMYQGGLRTYPLRVEVNGTQVFSGTTQLAADFWSVDFTPTYGDTVTITMTGSNSSNQNWFSIWEAEVRGYAGVSCHDGLKNQSETGIDCGGPCPTPCGQRQLENFSAIPGGNTQTPAAYAIDGNTSTRFTNDSALGTAALTIELQESATITGVELLMYNGSNRTYPLRIDVDTETVFTGNTAISAGYWPVSFSPTVGKRVKLTMTGANSAGQNWLSIYEAHVLGVPFVNGPATCYNGIQDLTESGVDCGGACAHTCSYMLPRVAATASSSENSTKNASKAIDGNFTTRWSSAFSNPQWLSVDLGTAQHIEQVNIYWEAATSADYDIQVSATGVAGTWETVRSLAVPTSGSRIDRAKYLGAVGRYVRIYSRARSTAYGNSIFELEILGSP